MYVKQYVKKPAVISAIQFIDDIYHIKAIKKFLNVNNDQLQLHKDIDQNTSLLIKFPDYAILVFENNYIMKDTEGEFHPVPQQVFEEAYNQI